MAESTKERIIQAAFSFYKVLNFDRVSLSQIAGRVGISKAAIFKHFKNKEAITQEMNNRIFDSVAQVIDKMVPLYKDGRSGEAVSVMVEFLLGHREYMVYFMSVSILFDESFMVSELRKRDVKIFDSVIGTDGVVKELKTYNFYHFIGSTLMYFVMERFHDEDLKNKGQVRTNFVSPEEFSSFLCVLLENGIADKDTVIDKERLSFIDRQCMEEMKNIRPMNKMLKVIATLVETGGVAGLTVEKIAGALGMAKSSLYSFYENKLDMLSSLIGNEFLALQALISANIAVAHTASEKVYAIMQTEFCYFKERSELIIMFRNLLIHNSLELVMENDENVENRNAFMDFLRSCFCDEVFNESELGWIMLLPVMLFGLSFKGFDADVIQNSLRDVFFMVEFGINRERI